jgi:FAD/FMN-containing dehydrogenase/Fe-S oxidoreductase
VDQAQRNRIRDDLRGIVRGDLLFDELSRVLYSTDASIFQVEPAGIVAPRDEADVQALVRYAAEQGVPLVARGAGSGLAGESLGYGLIVDLSRHFRAILEVSGDMARVQPGVVLRELNARLAREGRRFAPDPTSGEQCTIGGMLATNASGARALLHGYTRDHVAALRVVLDTGEVVAARRLPRWPAADVHPGRLEDIVSSTATLLDQNADLIHETRPATPFNRCGYLLNGVLEADHVNLPRLLVGSEGTLALFTEATLRTIPLPAGRALVLLGFDSLETALRAVPRALSSGVAACDLLDRRLLTLARGGDAGTAALVPAAADAILLVEFESDTPAEAREAARQLAERMRHAERLAPLALVAVESADIDRLWHVREAALPSLYGLRGGARPVPFIEDVAVPREHLQDCLHGIQDILKRHEVETSFLIHAATGQVHTRPFLDLQEPSDVAKLWSIADEVYAIVLEMGGTISAQHGTGLARTPWVARQYGQLYPVFRELKAIFDPRHLFNPGKIIGPDIAAPRWPLRHKSGGGVASGGMVSGGVVGSKESPAPDRSAPTTLRLPLTTDHSLLTTPPPTTHHSPLTTHLRWRPEEARTESSNCNGCGECRTTSPGRRMCPIYRATHTEAATPRAKANLMRYLLQAGENVPPLSADEVRAVADLCVNCKMCASECPAHVNIPKLMLEAKAANVARHGLDRASWALARTETFARLGSTFAFLTNSALASRGFRWLLEKMFGISRRRRLPRFASQHFLRRARRRGWSRPPRSGRPRVAYFVDVFATYNDPSIAEAAVAVLHHNGVEAYVPRGQRGCGMAPLACGDIETARELVLHNLRVLAEPAHEGYPILCSEPTAALMLRHDALDLLDDSDARLVAERVVELTSYLWGLHDVGQLRTDFRRLDLTIGHHVPCHLKALGKPAVGPSLLSLIPGLRVHTIDVNCSGMAGTFGLKSENYELSFDAGRPMLEELRHPGMAFGSTECSTCRMQMEDGAGKRTLHPVQYMALAYGLMPELGRRLHEPIRELVL